MKRLLMLLAIAPLATAIALFAAGRQGPVTYGTLDNFDVINDTGQETHGFEIELEGISSGDVAYTFAAPYIRYDTPTVVPTSTGVIVRYASTYVGGAWTSTTPVAVPPYLPTDGHSCWTGGGAGDAAYYASGCDHFGLSLNAAPTKTTYRWLVESAPGSGTLTPFGTNVKLPAPTWNVTPPAPGAQPVVAAVVAPPAPTDKEFGEALWVKVFVTELPHGLQPSDLEHMVIDDPDVDIMPEPAEVEWEWFLLQASTSGVTEDEFGGLAEVGAGNEAVSRRFEFYAYAGYYDPETNEGRCDNPLEVAQQVPDRCGDPDANGVAGVGELIGTQNVAINVAGGFAPANQHPVAQCANVTVAASPAVCTAPASVDNGSYDLDLDPLTLTQSPAGPYGFGATTVTLTASDGISGAGICQAVVTVTDSTAPSLATVTATPSTIQTANGKMIPVTVATAGVSDTCDAAPVCKITGVAGSEPDTGLKGDKSPDFEITGDLTVNLRAEREKKGPGRTYTIAVECTDSSGNKSASKTTTVTVMK